MRGIPDNRPRLELRALAAPGLGRLERGSGAEHAEVVVGFANYLETGWHTVAGESARNARHRALTYQVERVGHHPLHVRRDFLAVDGEIGVVVLMVRLHRRHC